MINAKKQVKHYIKLHKLHVIDLNDFKEMYSRHLFLF